MEVVSKKKKEKKREEKKNEETGGGGKEKNNILLTCPISWPALVTCTVPSWWIETMAGFGSTLITNLHAAIANPFLTKRFEALCSATARRRESTSASRLRRDHMRGTVYLFLIVFY